MMSTFRAELTLTPEQIRLNPVYVLTDSDSIAGYYLLRAFDPAPNGPSMIELEHLFIDPLHLRQGFGTLLFNHAIGIARTAGFQVLLIQSDPNAAGFYKKRGIPLVEEVPSSIPGRTIPRFELNLNA